MELYGPYLGDVSCFSYVSCFSIISVNYVILSPVIISGHDVIIYSLIPNTCSSFSQHNHPKSASKLHPRTWQGPGYPDLATSSRIATSLVIPSGKSIQQRLILTDPVHVWDFIYFMYMFPTWNPSNPWCLPTQRWTTNDPGWEHWTEWNQRFWYQRCTTYFSFDIFCTSPALQHLYNPLPKKRGHRALWPPRASM